MGGTECGGGGYGVGEMGMETEWGGAQVGHNVGTRGGLGAPGGGLWGDRVGFLQTPNALTPSPSSDPTSTSGETEARDRAPPPPPIHPMGPFQLGLPYNPMISTAPHWGGGEGVGSPHCSPLPLAGTPLSSTRGALPKPFSRLGGGGGGGLSCHVGF